MNETLTRCNKPFYGRNLWRHDTQHYEIQHNSKLNATLSITILSIMANGRVVMLNVINAECCKQTHYAECRYAECRYTECRSSIIYEGL
jgi:hypothetical protein